MNLHNIHENVTVQFTDIKFQDIWYVEKTICMFLLHDAHLHSTFLSAHFNGLDAFHKSPNLNHYVTLLHDDDRMQ